MSKLVAFGCSLTFGSYLDDIHPDNNTPSKLAWPQVLGDLAGIPVDNQANPGASNKEIAHQILNYNFDPTDIVVVCWSFSDRFCIIRKDNMLRLGVWHANPKYFSSDELEREKQQVSTAFFTHMHDENDMSLNQHYCIHYANLFLNSKKIKNYHLMARNFMKKDYKFFDTPMLTETDYLQLIVENPLALDNDHPGKQTHQLLAQEIFEETKGLTL
jgi:hypothetical protein|tara:strand:+ start:1113 stop:1757 length:645 start_codon:yes stop_codon:yes gene_type:complete